MRARPLAAFTVRPVHKPVVKRVVDAEVINVLSEGEALSVRAMKRPLKVLKQQRSQHSDGEAS